MNLQVVMQVSAATFTLVSSADLQQWICRAKQLLFEDLHFSKAVHFLSASAQEKKKGKNMKITKK